MCALRDIDWKKYEQIYLISFYGTEHVKRWFRLHNIRYQWIYDIFEEKGIFLQREFFALGQKDMFVLFDVDKKMHTYSGYEGGLQCELYCQKNTYENTDNYHTKYIALEKCLFITLYMRNFIAAKEYASLLSVDDEKYRNLWVEIQELLNAIRGNIKKRQQKDIILYWMDAVSYGDESEMPYLRSVMEKSIVFENAYTCVLYTHPTLRTIFLGKKDMDDHTYNITNITWENSPVVRLLRENGYDIKVISGTLDKYFPAQCTSDQYYQIYDPASMKLWDMLSNMLKQEEKTLYIVHCLEAHYPYLSCKMEDNNYMEETERYKLSRQELDEQLAFYDVFLHEEAYRIYMSDHGQSFEYHVLFNIYHKTLEPRKIDGMFSYLDFYVVLKQIVTAGSIEEAEFVKEYVEIGFLDYYNARDIGRVFREKTEFPSHYFGYTGIIGKEYIYLRYSIGKEWLRKRNDILLGIPSLFYDCESDICEPGLLPYYRELAGEYPVDIIEDDKFRFTRYLYALYYNIMKHNDISKRVDILNGLLNPYPENSVGIRMGGVHSMRLYYLLSKENKRKIWGFIDNSDECICSNLHLPIIRPTQIEELTNIGVKAILLSSYVNLDMIRTESALWGKSLDVLDIYDYLEKNGIICKKNFYAVEVTDEDYDIGLPFDDGMKSSVPLKRERI